MKKLYHILIIIVLLSLFLRLNNLDWETLTYGEVEVWQAATEYMKGNFVNNLYNFDTPPLFKYLTASSILAFGFSEISMRIISVVFGMLTIFMTFLFAKKYYTDNAALLASALVGFSFINIEFSRYALYDSMLPFFFLLTAYFFLDKSEKSWLYLGAAIGIGMSVKFNMIFMVIAILVFSVLKNRSVYKIDKKIIKSFIAAAIVFFIIWPFSLLPLTLQLEYSVHGIDNIGTGETSVSIPIFLLSLGKRIVTSSERVVMGTFEDIPFFNYPLLYLVKENILISLMMIAGIVYAFRKKIEEKDKFLLLASLVVFVLLISQKWNYSTRHIMAILPFILIVSSKHMHMIKDNMQRIFIIAVVIILFLSALLVTPFFMFYNSPVSAITGESKSEKYLSEGIKETLEYSSKCSIVRTTGGIVFESLPYTDKFSHNATVFDCMISPVYDELEVPDKCKMEKEISKNNMKIITIYRCL